MALTNAGSAGRAPQDYTPVTFSLSLFAVGDKYTDATVQHIVDRLLAAPPARRQPEATHT